MQLGLVGLGKMGFNMRQRLREGGHEVIGFDPRPDVSDVASLQALAEALTAPRVVWVMVPSGPITDETIVALSDVLSPGDVVVDGGCRHCARVERGERERRERTSEGRKERGRERAKGAGGGGG